MPTELRVAHAVGVAQEVVGFSLNLLLHSANTELQQQIETEANYFLRNADRMRYPQFRRQGLFVGSGVIEAGCKTVIAARLKRSGMFWSVRGANSIIALRCYRMSGKFEDYWETRRG